MQKIEVLAGDAPARADAEIAELGRLVGGVPALHDSVEALRPLVRRISPEPGRLDHAAALRCRHLLILAGEIVFAQSAADLLEHLGRLALGVQGLARLAAKGSRPEHRLDPVGLRLIGDRREAHYLPRLLLQYMAGEVVPRVMPEGRLSCRRCMISTMAPLSLSLS